MAWPRAEINRELSDIRNFLGWCPKADTGATMQAGVEFGRTGQTLSALQHVIGPAASVRLAEAESTAANTIKATGKTRES
jgi:hypothetical protein